MPIYVNKHYKKTKLPWWGKVVQNKSTIQPDCHIPKLFSEKNVQNVFLPFSDIYEFDNTQNFPCNATKSLPIA
jgi:hypothetical protein